MIPASLLNRSSTVVERSEKQAERVSSCVRAINDDEEREERNPEEV